MKKTVKAGKKSAAGKKPAHGAAAKRTAAPAKAPAKAAAARGQEIFTKTEMEEIKLKLTEMRDSLSRNMEDKRNLDMQEPEVGDSIDQATQSLDKEILFELSDNERKMLDSIDAALRKMDNSTYGRCEHCKNPIEKKRLKALPSARYCMSCQNGAERTRAQ